MKNTRTALIAALTTLIVAPVAYAYDDTSETHVDVDRHPIDAVEEDEEEEEVWDGGDDGACGGDASPLDEADMLLGDQDWTGLYHEVGGILREGRADWQRAQALSYLATAQLHMGRTWPAARNFELAFALDAEQVSPALRVEQAIALVRNGRPADAHRAAQLFAEDECVAPTDWLVSTCWAARTVMAETSDDVEEQGTQRQLAAALVPEDEARLAQIADYRELLGTAVRVASR